MQPEIVHSTLDNMPFLLALWAPTESNELLVQQWELLTASQQMPLFKAEHRKREWLATRLLMDNLGIEQHDFLANGKPILPRGGISISHCKGSVAVVTSEVNIGLDIQEPTEQIFTIRSKFCSATEWRWLETHCETLRALTIVWSAKEAIFKYWGEEVDFAQHIEILPFECDASIIDARYKGGHGERNFRLWHSTRGTLEVVIAI